MSRIWDSPWTLREGFLIGGGLLLVGLLLELAVGPVCWDVFQWPFNGVVLAVFLLIVATVHLLRRRVSAFRFVSTVQAAIPAMTFCVLLTIVMGLTRQRADGSWFSNMLTFWPFVLIYVYMALILGVLVLRQLSSRPLQSSTLSHLGLFITMTTATLGNADMQRLKMICTVGEPEWRALDMQQHVVELPLTIELKRFIMEVFDDGSPKRFASDIEIRTLAGEKLLATVDVNKPVEAGGWEIYQYGYDTQMGIMSSTTILELVRDPWLPAVYAGIYMMLAGAVLMFISGGRHRNRHNKKTAVHRNIEQTNNS